MQQECVYKPLADELAERIRAGELAPGDWVPSVRSISQGALGRPMTNVVAQKVHKRLRAQGLIESVLGLGTVVADPEDWITV